MLIEKERGRQSDRQKDLTDKQKDRLTAGQKIANTQIIQTENFKVETHYLVIT